MREGERMSGAVPATGARVGVDIGGTSVRVLRESGGVRGEVRAVPVPGSYDELLGLLTELAGPGPAVIGVGLPGTSDGGRPMFVPALPWLQGRPFAEDLRSRTGAPVRLGLDGHLTLLAEAAEGAAEGARSAVLVAVGTGIGGALMIDGRVWRGAHGSAGSWGWLPSGDEGVERGHGPYELAASGTALGPRGPELVSAARDGDQAALTELRPYAARLGRGIAALASVLDPEVILVGGGLSGAMDVLAPLLDIDRFASPDGRRVPVRAAALGPYAGVVGALLAAGMGDEW
ncbi:ROK family protein [Spongiactinospora sp. TRM90649]|uniref:ROK family protein n=1 Tax=Spongiactinospora sp. TRM90649 TaxID=3031114 RepID=UPI0023F71EAA|nr:ROK family protein [Spongiactinospora sp. TRM90649]MDF5756232.1 ROK family protein [Spongiactinospora sp. TRM90649]